MKRSAISKARPIPAGLRAAASAALLALALAAGAQSLFGLSPEDDKRVGGDQHPKILEQFGGAYDDPKLARYVDSIGQFLAATSHAPGIGYTFTVLDSPIVNAFAVPGGYVYLTRGLLALAGNEAEIAGVLAHEIAHITARHGARRQTKGTLASLGLAVLGAVTDNPALVNLGRVGAHAVLSAYSRKEEHEADEIGVTYLSRAGFDPGAMSSFLATLKRQSELEASKHGRSARPGLDFLATHPRTRDRGRTSRRGGKAHDGGGPHHRAEHLPRQDRRPHVRRRARAGVRARAQVRAPGHRLRVRGSAPVPPAERRALGDRLRPRRSEDALRPAANRTGPAARPISARWLGAACPAHPLRALPRERDAGATALARGSDGRGARLVAIRFRNDTVARFLFVPSGRPGSGYDRRYRAAAASFRRLRAWEAQSVKPWRIAIHEVGPGDTVDRLVDRRFRARGGTAPPVVPAAERPGAGRTPDRRPRQADR